jgi:hypothetical protein
MIMVNKISYRQLIYKVFADKTMTAKQRGLLHSAGAYTG